MPIYKLNGKTYNIPDDVVSRFEQDNPNATIAYSVGDKKYEIPLSKREGFLSAFPGATLDGVAKPKEQPTPANTGNNTDGNAGTTDFTMKESELEGKKKDGDKPILPALSPFLNDDEPLTEDIAKEIELQKAYDERKRLKEQIELYDDYYDNNINPSLGWGSPSGYSNKPKYSPDFKYDAVKHSQLINTKRVIDKRIATLEESVNKDKSGFWRNLWRTVTTPSTWSFGLVDLSLGLEANELSSKVNNGEELTDEEQQLLQQMVLNQEAQEKYGGDKGFMARAGSITGEALPFVGEFFLTGGFSSVSHGVGKGVTKGIAKATATDLSKKGLRSWLVKSTGTVTGDVAAAGLMANTTGAAKTAADAMDRHRGQIIQDENGDYHFGHYEEDENGDMQFVDGGKSWARSIYEAEAANTLEYYTEMLGTHIEKPLGAVGSWIAEKTGMKQAGAYMISKLGLGEVSKDLSQITANGYGRAIKNVLERGGIQDYPSEVLEEEANIILNSMLVGDNSLSDLVDGRTQADIWGGMLFSVGFMQSPAVVAGGVQSAQYLKAKHQLENADKNAGYIMEDENWTPIRERIDATSNEEMADLVVELMNDDSITPTSKGYVMDYIGKLTKFRGFNVGSTAKAKDEVENPTDEGTATVIGGVNNSYMGGYEANEEQYNDLKNGYEFQRKRIGDVLTEEGIARLDEDPIGTLEQFYLHDTVYSDEEKQTIYDYVNAKQAYEGMIARVRDDIDSRIALSNSAIDCRVHREDGMIHPATLTTDRKVYVVGGTVVMSDDGTMVDRDATRAANGGDGMILVTDAESGKIEPLSVEEFLSVDEPIDAAKEKEIAQEAIRQEYAQKAASKIDGVLPFANGDQYTVVDEQGAQHTVVVLPTGTVNSQGQILQAGNDEVIVSVDGAEPIPMSRAAIQEMADNANLARLQQFEQEKAARRVEQAEAEREASRPVYNINDEVTLQTEEGTVRGSITAEANEDGMIEVYTERPIGGKKINLYNRDELDRMVTEHNGAIQELSDGETSDTPSQETGGGVDNAGGEASPEQTGANDPSAATTEPMPMIGEGEEAEPDFTKATPERAHAYLYNESGLSRDEANQFIDANKKAADKALEKAKNAKPKIGTSIAKYKKEQSEYQQKVEAAEQVANYWQQVKDAQQKVLAAEAEERAKEQAALTQQAIADEQQRQEEELQKREEQAQLGTHNVAPAIREKWEAANKVEGARNEIVLANGEKVPGKYILVESGAATPSHNPHQEFAKNEGFPVDENGQSVNDRDYERDKDAQATTRNIASIYDQRALQTPVVVTNDGIVLSGNGRTMAGELAAENNTDGAYIEHLKEYGNQFGFTPEQIGSMEHPRVVFVPDASMPYTADTFAKFNQQEMKGQSKTEQAVKLGKIVDDDTFGRIIRSINGYDTLADYYANPSATTEAINELRKAGAISEAQYAEMFDGDGISAQGREVLENMLIGKAFESNPDAVRQITSFKGVRHGIISALAEISNNLMLGEGYSHEAELAQAINLVYQARKSGYKSGEPVSGFARQMNLFDFDEGATVADFNNATVLMYADLLNEGKPSMLKKVLALYNQAAKDSANGQLDIFSGGVKTQEEILNDVKQILRHGTEKEQQEALAAAAAERIAASEQQPGVHENGTTGEVNQPSEADAAVAEESPVAAAEREVNTNPSDAQKEAGNYKKGHVKIDGYDISIENPKGSERSGTDANGHEWKQTMNNTYGYIRRTEGVDGDHIDVFLSDNPESGNVYVIDQRKPDGTFDEHKVMYGFNSAEEARNAYLSNYEEGWQGLGTITEVSKDEFKKWIDSSHRKTKPFAEYKSVKPISGQNEATEPQPVGFSILGNLYDQFKGKAKEAIQFLLKNGEGDAVAALHHKDVGDIDLWYGNDKAGLKKIAEKHPEVLDDLQGIIDQMHVVTSSDNRIVLESDTHRAVVSKMLGKEKTDNWLLSAYEKKGTSASSSDIETEPKGKRNGTAAPQSPLSEGKGTEKSDNVQENNEKTSYSVTPKDYTTKRGKVLNMQLVKFGKELDKEQQRKANALAKKWAGWWSREDGGFMMRDEDSADLFARTVLDAEALENEQPISLSEMTTATDMAQAVAPAEEVTAQPQQAEQQTQDEPVKSKWVDEEDAARFEELKRRMHKKMFGQLNMGVDPEILAIGTEMAFYVIKHGARKFGEYAKAMVDELGDAIRPYLKSFYNGARDFPEMEKFASDMSPYEEVRAFDVLSVGNDVQPTLLDKAEEITKEQEVEQQAIEAEEKLTEQRNDVRKAHEEHPDMRPVTEADLEASHPIVYYKGKPYGIIAVMHSGEQISATQFSKPHLDKVILTNGEGVTLDQLSMIDGDSWAKVAERADNAKQEREATEDRETVKKRKERLQSKKKNVSLQQELDLFGDLSGEDANNAEPSNSNNNDEGRENRPSSTGVSQRTPEGSERANSGRLDGNLQEGRNVERGNSGVSQAASGERSGSERPAGRIQELENTLRVPDGGESEPATTRPAGKLGGEGSRSAQFINPKNLRNNHAEQGKDYAPKSVDARIEANIKAIELMKQLIESGEQATPAQMAVLRQFSGWGGLGKAFENYTAYTNGKPTPQYLRELLGEEAYEQANMSRNSAYYTPAGVIEAMWNVARAMGFKGGNMLEGSAGIGNIIGLMPSDMSERSDIHAVEIDQTTGNILKLLYPDANVEVQGFEATKVENGSIDLAITNVPFVTGLRVKDTTGDKDLSKKFHDIHDFCIAKNIRKLREGGIGIFITSSGTLDNSTKLRSWIVQEGGSDVVGAFRLNNETFGGTGATSDIIVVRKRVNGKKSPYAIDVLSVTGERTAEYDTGDVKKVKGEYVPVVKQLSMDYNSYFIEHPEHMAGEMLFNFEKGETRYPTSRSLFPSKDKNQAEMLQSWTESFAGKDWESSSLGELPDGSVDVYEDLGEDVKEGSIVVNSGKLCIAQRGKAVPLDVNANKVKGHTKVECFEAYQGIKKALAELLEYQTTTESDEGLQPLLKALNKAYDSFVKTYGHLHRNTSISFLKNDVDFANILALEKFSERPDITTGKRIQEYGKTDIFSQRVVEKEKAQEPKNVKDAIIASIYVHGRIDLPWMVEKLSGKTAEHSMTEQEIKDEIVASGLGFENPTTRQIEVSYEYLSGNVREKLRQAQENNTDGRYDTNIKALEAVIPASIPAHLIDFSIGSSWIDPKLYAEYVKEKTDIDVTFTAASGTWYMKAPSYVGEQKNRAMGITSEVLHRTIMGTQLIEAAMQNKTIEVKETRKKWDGSTETVVDKAATQACSNKIDEIRQDFKDWARAKMQSDPEMRDQIEHIYNEMFNNYVPKSIPDEFVPDHFGGAATMVDGKPFALRPHQGKAVVRGTTQPLLLAHEVGTGKTYTLISTAMEMRRLGTARKPMIVVQNATVGQFVESAKKLYPNAKVLTLEEKDHTSEGRKNFYAKIKYNDWDMIVVPQSVFERIPDSEERQMKFVQDKIEEKLFVLEQMKDADPNGQSMIVRQAEKEIDSLQEELAGLAGAVSDKRKERDEKKKAVTKQNAEVKALEMLDRQTDDVENFDDMGIDAILVDEAHEYKHLGFATAMQRGVKGVDPSYSKKAQGVFLKTQAVLEKNNGRNVIFATGTPISNTAAEIWTFMRYLMPSDTMKEYGIYFFDDFVRNFGNLQQMLEFTTSGKFKENNRFAGYVNLPELVRIWAGVADTVLTREAGGVNDKIPAMEGDKATDIYLPQTRALRSVMKFVKKELERFDKMSGKEKKENSHIPLTMYGIAKAAAVDARLVVTDAEDDPHSKTNEAVRQTLKTLKETESYKGTVAIFADNYQNKKSGFNPYEDIREKLIAQGVPAGQIVVMKSGMSVKKKLEIFDAVNRGEIRVIMGSTFTLGTGVNIQERLHTLIHLDAPNRPMDYTQRNGRILRQGNMHKEMGKPVRVLRFGVEDSLDVTAYQRLKTKGAIADSIMNGKQMMANSMENRALEEEEDVFGDTVAQLSGSEYAMLKNQAEKDVRKFEAKKKQYEADQTYCHGEIPRLESYIKMWKVRLEESRKNLSTVEALPHPATIKAGSHTFDSIDAMADFIKEYNKSVKDAENHLRDNPSINAETRRLTVNIGGLNFVFITEMRVDTMKNQGELFTAIRRKMTYTCKELGLNDVTVFQSLLREGLEDIIKNVITGNDSRDWIERSERNIAKCERSLEQVRERYGKPFEFTEELKKAHERLDEYSELMKKELEEKERKYAEMDADVEEAGDISEAEEADEEEDDDDGVHFRTDDTEDVISQYEQLSEHYNGKPYSILKFSEISDGDFAVAIGVPKEDIESLSPEELHEEVQKLKDDAIKRKSMGGYSPSNRKIAIFAENIPLDKVEEFFFHENLHGILHDLYEDGARGIAERFHDIAPSSGGFVEWSFIEKGYKDKTGSQKEEFFVYSLSRAMTQGRASEVLDMLSQEDSERADNILNIIGYDRQSEETVRRAEGEEPNQGDLGQHVSSRTTPGRRRLRDGEGAVERLTEEESLAASRRAGYSKKQYEAWREREQRRAVQRVNYVIDSLHLRGRAMTYESFDDVPKSLTSGMSQKRKRQASLAKGWYDEKTGQIVVILGNHGSVSDVIKTILHEGVAHYGLRKLFGKRFDDFLDAVYNLADPDVRRGIVELAKKHNWDFREATEEYLARLAEDTDFENAEKSGWWHKIKSLFLDMLHQLLDSSYASLSNNELRYILWRSYMNMAAPGRYKNPFIEAEDINMQMQLGVGRFANERRRIFGLGKIDDRSLSVAEGGSKQHFRDGDFSSRDRATARNAYERMVRSGAYQFREAVQDSMLGLKKLYEAILDGRTAKHTRIEDVAGNENAYLAENRMSSVNAAEQHDYYLNFMKPLLDEVFAIAGKSNGARQALTDYMMAKHGLERNLVFAARDANEVAASGGDYDEAYNKFRERDYSGLTSLTGEKDIAAAEAAAQKIVDDYESAYDTTELWNRTREATHATLDKIYRSGLLSKDRYERIRDMFEYYIPLQGWDETTSDEVYGYLTSKNGAFGSPIKHAEGRSSKADDPIATIGLMADTAIRQGNRNQMKQRFLNFVLNNPSDLVSVHDLWLEYYAAEDEWKPVFADIEESDTAEDVERKVEAFERHMTQLAEAEPDRYKRGSDAKNIPYKVVKGNLKEHQILVRRGGHTYVLTINGNPRAAQALNGLTNPDVETSGVVGNILKLGEYINRNLSAFYTTRNPDFVVSNFFRDMLYSNCMTWVKESPRYALRYHKNFGRLNPVTLRKLLGKWEKGALDQSNYTERMFYQFMINGGETGYTSVRDIEAHKKEIADELKKQGSTLRQVWAALGTQLDLLNRGVENCARFAAFVTSREMGRSIDRSIYDAKEVSVNFNKKGSGGKMVNANGQTLLGKIGSYIGGTGRLAYVFWNAGVQGLTNFGRTGKRNAGKAFAGASAMFILGYIIPQLAAAMGGGDGDDDDKNAYYNLPEYVRRTNICFRIGEQWVTIPLPIEFRGLYGLGELTSGVLSDNEHYDNKELSYQIASQVSQILPLDMLEGGGGINALIPSSVKPFYEAYIMNKSWTGLPIYKDTSWNQNDPEWTKAYKNADQTLVGISRWLNAATGGDDFKKGAIDINPAKLEYLLSGVFGGYMNTAEKFKKMGETALGDREFDWRNMLLANRVVKSGDERTANRKLQNEYFKYRKEYEETKRLLREYEDAADEGIAGMAEKVDFLYNSQEYFRYEIFDEYKSDIDDYREDMQEAANEEERKEIEADMYATMRELIDQLHEVK